MTHAVDIDVVAGLHAAHVLAVERGARAADHRVAACELALGVGGRHVCEGADGRGG